MPKAKTDTKKTSGKPKKKDAGKRDAPKKDAPKKNAGAKLTKAFRNFGPIKELMNSDLGREILADVITAAASAAALALTKSRDIKSSIKKGAVAAEAKRESVKTAAGAVADVMTDAARHFLPASLLAEDVKPAKPARAKATTRSAPRKPKAAANSDTPKKRRAPRKAAAPAAPVPEASEA